MKKHILGVALFSLIVASFAIVYAFFYSPSIPPKEAVKPPVSQTEPRAEKPYSCQLKRNQVSYEILSSQLDLDTNKLTSKVKLTWNGEGKAPDEVYMELKIVTAGGFSNPFYFTSQTLDNPFTNGNQTITTIESEISAAGKINKKENLYAFFSFSQDYLDNSRGRGQRQSYQVLVIHGKDSAVKNAVPRKE